MNGSDAGAGAIFQSGGEAAGRRVLENIMTRTSVRNYLPRPVDRRIECSLLKAAMAAPSAVDRRPWSFVVIRENALRQALAEKLVYAGMTRQAPLAILVCGDLDRRLEGEAADFWIQDVSAATQNLLLAAHALGLGAVWCGVFPMRQRVKDVRSIAGLPEHIVPFALVPVGYPAEAPDPKNKWDEALIHYERW